MRSTLFTLFTLAASALALPKSSSSSSTCLTSTSANRVASNFRTLITNYSNASATAYLTPDFTDYSDGVNTLINSGCPNGPATLGSATFTSREAFQAGQGGQPNIPFEILNVWYGCTAVTMRWRSSAPGGPAVPQESVTGIVVLETVRCSSSNSGGGERFRIKTVYSEFNSGAWLYDLGVFVPDCGV